MIAVIFVMVVIGVYIPPFVSRKGVRGYARGVSCHPLPCSPIKGEGIFRAGIPRALASLVRAPFVLRKGLPPLPIPSGFRLSPE